VTTVSVVKPPVRTVTTTSSPDTVSTSQSGGGTSETQPPIRSVVTTKSNQEVVTHVQVSTVIAADVGQSGPAGAKGDTGNPGVYVGPTAPSDTTLVWVDTSVPIVSNGALGHYGSLYSTARQWCTSASTGQPMLFDGLDSTNGISLVNGSRITISRTGVYNFQWSGQFTNYQNNTATDVRIWISIDGTPWAGSTGVVTVPGNGGHIVSGWNFIHPFTAGQYFQFIWASDVASTTNSGIVLDTPPVTAYSPTTSSVVATIQQV
jgi:hypothetical protein